MHNPLDKSREELAEVIGKITRKDSPVGIDAEYTHAAILDYLHQIAEQLERLDHRINVLTQRISSSNR